MSASHTPGPWSLPHFAKPDVNCECGYVLTDHLMGAVCTVHASGDGDDWARHGDNPKFAEACANARLISSAPELKTEVAEICAILDNYSVSDGEGSICYDFEAIGEEVSRRHESLTAVLTKALGL